MSLLRAELKHGAITLRAFIIDFRVAEDVDPYEFYSRFGVRRRKIRQMPSNGIRVNASRTTLPISAGVMGIVLKSVPPKKIIRIWITEISSIMMMKGRFLLILDSIHIRSHRAEKQLKMPRNMNSA